MRKFYFVLPLLLFICLAACQAGMGDTPTAPVDKPRLAAGNPDIRGEITNIHQKEGITVSVLVEGEIEADTGYDKASVTITDTTRIYEKVGEDYLALSREDLYLGLRVEVLFTGVVLESYPVQTEAEEIVILR